MYQKLKKNKKWGNFMVASYMIQNVLQKYFPKKFQKKIELLLKKNLTQFFKQCVQK